MTVRSEYARPSGAAFIVAALALATGGATTAATTTRVIGHGTRLRTTRIFFAQGTAVAPKSVSVALAPTPTQPVEVQWSLVCQKPNRADPAIQIGANARAGQITVRGTGSVSFELPFSRPPTCVASVYATLAHKGSLVLRLEQT